MNSGSIANRYAQALMSFVIQNGTQDAVSSQVSALLSAMKSVPKLKAVIVDRQSVPLKEKLSLLDTLFAPDATLHADLSRLITIMNENGRIELLRLVLLDFLYMYREQHGILHVRVTLPDENAKIPDMLEKFVQEKFNKTALINTKIDPEIIGGFIVESTQYRLDASVRTQLDRSLKLLSAKYKKIV